MTTPGIYARYETDTDAEANGKWITDEFGPDIQLKIRRFNCPAASKARNDAFRPLLKVYGRMDKIPEALSEEIGLKLLADVIVTDWRGAGLVDKAGNPIPFSPEAALKLFTDLPDFAREVTLVSIAADNFRKENKDEVAKNF